MVQGGTTNPTNSDEFIENVVRYISGKKRFVASIRDSITSK